MRIGPRVDTALSVTSILALVTTIAACGSGGGNADTARGTSLTGGLAASSPSADLPECPKSGDWHQHLTRKRVTIPANGDLTIAKRRTHIPEFHDCQQFIVDGAGGRQYLSLFAIFSSDSLAEKSARLDSVKDTLRTRADTNAVRNAGRVPAVGEIYALDSGYKSLGIEHDFNCLFVYGKVGGGSNLEAKVVPVGTDETKCGTLDPATATGAVLEVRRHHYGKAINVPDVARWDWDATNHQQYMGVGCGSSWCEIGPKSFVPSNAHASMPVPPNPRELAVKGWYDEQTLAFPTSGGGLTVGTVVGTIVLMHDLGDQDGSPGKNFESWKAVATAAIDTGSGVYFTKLNLAPSPITSMTDTIYLCQGTWANCAGAAVASKPKCAADSGWWGKIVSTNTSGVVQSGSPGSSPPPAPSIKYFCVTRRTHPGITIPAVVRWRWSIKDETLWVPCESGCCEYEAETES